jgi:CheY-like chemotaxis protein
LHDTQKLTILLVDDDDVDVRAITRSLRKGCIDNHIAVAKDGLQAPELLRGTSAQQVPWPYVVLLDINMPQMNGQRDIPGRKPLRQGQMITFDTRRTDKGLRATNIVVGRRPLAPQLVLSAVTLALALGVGLTLAGLAWLASPGWWPSPW